jgi:Flp pilus assembly protein TadG
MNVPVNAYRRQRSFVRHQQCQQKCRRGVAAVEFAVIAPIFVIMILGIIEIGRAMMVQQILTNASREGARRAIVEKTTTTEVQAVVNDYLAGTSVSSGVTVNVSPPPGPAIGFGDPVSVTVSVPYNNVSWLQAPWILGGKQLTATSIMRAERPQ